MGALVGLLVYVRALMYRLGAMTAKMEVGRDRCPYHLRRFSQPHEHSAWRSASPSADGVPRPRGVRGLRSHPSHALTPPRRAGNVCVPRVRDPPQ